MSNIKLTLLIFCSILCIGGCSSMDTFGASLEPKKSDFPNRPINFIVAAGAGGGDDIQARSLEKVAYKHLKQPLVVLNKPGAAGTLGWNELYHSPRDGYWIGLSAKEMLLHTLYNSKKVHYFTTLDPIAQITSIPSILVVNNNSSWKNVSDIINYAKGHPQAIKYGHGGIGSVNHVIGALFAQKTNTILQQVPFQSGSEVVASLLGNHIQIAFVNPAVAKELIRNNNLRAIATTGDKRLLTPELKDTPTLKETGVDLVFTTWKGVAAPKELPPEVKAILEEGLKKAIAEPEFQENMEKMGLQIDYLDSEQSRQKWVREIEALKKMLDSTGILEEVRSHQK